MKVYVCIARTDGSRMPMAVVTHLGVAAAASSKHGWDVLELELDEVEGVRVLGLSTCRECGAQLQDVTAGPRSRI